MGGLLTHAGYNLECLGATEYHGSIGRSIDMKNTEKQPQRTQAKGRQGFFVLFLQWFCR